MGLNLRINNSTMDENWGNILYLILMALFVIVGALKKKKKPAENFEDVEVERKEDDMPVEVENLFDSLLGANSFAPQQDHPYQVIEEDIIEEEEEKVEKYERPVESEKHDTSLIMEVENLDDIEDNIEESEGFDWRQAIISKEILDRKYI